MTLSTPAPDPKTADEVSLTHRSYAAIRAMILSRNLKAGEIVSEDRLAARLATSRTPVREALLLLQSEGLLEKQPNQPFRVRVVSNREYFQTMRLRELLEGEAIATAIDRISPELLGEIEADMLALKSDPAVPAETHWAADEKLHEMIANSSGNAVLAGVIQDLRMATRIFELSGLASRFRPDTEEHLTIIEAIKSGDREQARASMQAHIRSLANDVLAEITGH